MRNNLIIGALIAASVFQVAPKASADEKTNNLIIGGIIGAVVGGAIANDRNDRRDDRRGDWRDDRRNDRRDDWGRGRDRGYDRGYDRGPGRGYPPPQRPMPPPQRPLPPPQRNGEASVLINGVTRQPGGAWYRLTLRYPLSLSNVNVHVLRAGLKIHEAAIVTDRQMRMPLYELQNTPVLYGGQYVNAYINQYERVLAIDIRAESYGDFADIAVGVSSNEGYPDISVSRF